MAGNKPGRRPRGDRAAITLRPPREHMDVYLEEARRLGYANLNEYLVSRLAQDHGLDEPSWVSRTDPGQLELAIGA